jgi:hypothetical protein
VDRIKHCDYIFKQDYFGDEEKMLLFRQKMAELNA